MPDRHAENSTSEGGHSGSDPQFVTGCLPHCSGMFQWVSVSVDSRKHRLISTEHPKCGTLSCWIPGTFSLWLCLRFLQKLVWYTYRWFWKRTCSSCVSLETAANFPLFLDVAIFLNRKKFNSSGDWFFCIFESTPKKKGNRDFL